MSNSIVQKLNEDCFTHGYGRKKWWADHLGVPALTLSHWLSGRQKPNGKHTLTISQILQQLEIDRHKKVWVDYLWDCYYSDQSVPKKIFPTIVLEILSLSTIDSRTLALLSRMTEREDLRFDLPSGKLRNRLGWLLTVSGKKAPFSCDRTAPIQSLLSVPLKSKGLKKYFQRFQTAAGKKWRVYDCPLDSLKRSLP